MAKCSKCPRDVVEAQYGKGKRLLDPVHHTYAAVALREQTQSREQGKAAVARQKGA